MTLRAWLPEQEDPKIGRERVLVEHEDGRIQELTLHDYDTLYSLPGVYETIVQERLRCVSPAKVAHLLATTADALGRPRAQERVIDVAAGNGISGEALAAEGLTPVFGTDIVPSARDAALRDRPGLYTEGYETLDLTALTAEQTLRLAEFKATALTCVAPVGEAAGTVPLAALAAAAAPLSDDALVAYIADPARGGDVVEPALFGPDARAEKLHDERYLHRQTVNGGRYEMIGVVWRVRR